MSETKKVLITVKTYPTISGLRKAKAILLK
jgi:hypothetical protein